MDVELHAEIEEIEKVDIVGVMLVRERKAAGRQANLHLRSVVGLVGAVEHTSRKLCQRYFNFEVTNISALAGADHLGDKHE